MIKTDDTFRKLKATLHKIDWKLNISIYLTTFTLLIMLVKTLAI